MVAKIKVWIFGLVLVLLLATMSLAAVPDSINFQGKLRDSNGSIISGNYDMTFRIYDEETSGKRIWVEDQNSISVNVGLFDVRLGSSNPINFTFNDSLWLSIEVNNDGEMSPRQRLLPSAYAFFAKQAENLSSDNNAYMITGGENRVVINNLGRVGIGTILPGDALLNVTGVIDASQLMVNGSAVSTSSFDASDLWNDIYANSTERLNDNTTLTAMILAVNESKPGRWNLSGTNLFPENLSYHIGIGTNSPVDLLELEAVNPGLFFDSSNWVSDATINITFESGDSYIQKNYDNGLIIEDNNKITFIEGGDSLVTLDGGNVGIGIPTPSTKLDVRGNGNFSGTVYINNETDLSQMISSTALNESYPIIDSDNKFTGINEFTENVTFGDNLTVGDNALYVDSSSGRVGIGTDNPTTKLSIYDGDVNFSTGNQMGFYYENATQSVKIGTDYSSLSSKLIIGGDILVMKSSPTLRLSNANNNSRVWAFQTQGSGDLHLIQDSAPSFHRPIKVETGAIDNMVYLDDSGNVGIGTTSPGEKLSVEGVINATGLMINGTEIGSGANISGGGAQNYLAKFSSSKILKNSIVFDTGSFVGIGTAVPTHELTVQGSTNITGSLYVGGVPITGGSGEAANVTSNGTANYITKFLNSTNLGNSILYEISNKIGIGKLNPLAILDIEQSPVGDLELNVSGVLVVNGTSGWVGIGKGSPSQALTVTGDGNITGDLYVGNITMGEDELTNTGGELYWKGAPISTAGGWTNVSVYDSAGDYTFTVPTGVTHIYVEVWGAGGAGGGAPTSETYAIGAGGGGGGYGAELVKVTEGAEIKVTVGAGGKGVFGENGHSGGNSSFGSYCNATGGGGGEHGYYPTTYSAGGGGGQGSNCEINLIGGTGETGHGFNYDMKATGGAAPKIGVVTLDTTLDGYTNGANATSTGAGGGGGRGSNNNHTGGNGADGMVRVWWNDGSMNSVRTISSSIWNKTAANIYLGDSGDNVGIGTDSPTAKLNVVGGVNVTGNLTVEGSVIDSAGVSYVKMSTGTYSGNGASPRNITGLGFSPKFVICYQHIINSAGNAMHADVDTTYSYHTDWAGSYSANQYEEGHISAMVEDGFTAEAGCNTNGQVFTYIAWG